MREHGHTCVDIESAGLCSEYREQGQCDSNPGWMMTNCAHTCGLCLMTCEDMSYQCHDWAKDNGCEDNKEYMLKSCPASCGTCQKMVSLLEESIRAQAKDEL